MATHIGSIWRKWDLHVHTPASLTWQGKQFSEMTSGEADDACRAVIERMNEADAAVFAVMDYWTFDGYLRLRAFLRGGAGVCLQKAVFPGMELRCEAPTAVRMNVHVLLSDELTDQQLHDFKATLRIPLVDRSLSDDALAEVATRMTADKLRPLGHRPSDLQTEAGRLQIGHKVALVSRDSLFAALEAIPPGTGLLFLPFDTYHGVREINWREHPLLTTEFMARAHILEVRQRDAANACQGIRTPENGHFFDNFLQTIGGRPKPAVSGSDAHSLSAYAVFPVDQHGFPRCTWVKAEPTFRGVRQIMTEPAARVFIGETPAKFTLVRDHPTKYIRSLTIRKKTGSDLTEAWFDVDLRFNHDLVAVIGNKGNGKSALADILGLLGNSKNHPEFSFLNPLKFRNPKLNKARHFEATLTWENGETVTRSLDELPGAEEVERVRYLPQNYLETVCNEVKLRQGDGFDAELKSVIFSHVPSAERLGVETLDQLLEFKTRQTHETIALLKSQLHDLNVQLVALEAQASPEHRLALKNQLALKEQELQAHDAVRPAEVLPPSADPQAQAEAESVGREIEQARTEQGAAEGEIRQAQAEERRLTLLLAKLTAVEGQLDNFERVYQELSTKIATDLSDLEIGLPDLVMVTIDRSRLSAKRQALDEAASVAKALLDPGQPTSPAARRQALTARVQELQSRLEGPARQYQEYITALSAWASERSRIVGDEETPGTLAYLRAALASLEHLPARLRELSDKRRGKAREIYAEIARLADVYRDVYRPVQDFTNRHELINERFGLNFSVAVRPAADLADRFFAIVHRGVMGSFCGTEEGAQAFKALIDRHDFSTEAGALAFADDVIGHLMQDKRGGKESPASIAKQLRKGQSVESLYDFIYSFDYLAPQYNLNLGAKELSQLSPGERGMLLLVFYLLIDKDDVPLIVDQPEGNLDNQTVFKLLGECIKEAKKRRQIIIVTHNPNLAVACDAEQIICASIDAKDGNRVRYAAGAIEDTEINRLLINILEGTRPAFDNRDSKYFADARA